MIEQGPTTNREQARHWLASILLRRGNAVMPRFARLHARLAARPRGWRRQLRRRLAVTVTGAALLLAMAGMGAEFAARAETDNVITVVNGEVALAKNGKCSLIEAINNANDTVDGIANKPGNDDCAAGNPNGADVIQLPAGGAFSVSKSVDYYYGYTALPVITSKITVEGNGSTITRTGKKDMRFFTAVSDTYDAGAADLTLNDLTLTNGKNIYYSGGAIYAYQATLTINNCTITGNEAGANGGGIFAGYTDVTITESTISGNKSYGGGGVYAGYGSVTIIDSTLSGNVAPDSAGGGAYLNTAVVHISNVIVDNNKALSGSGVLINYSDVTIADSVISNNKGDGGAYSSGGGIYLSDTTGTLNRLSITGNEAPRGGGVFAYGGSVAIKSSTLSGNKATAGGGLYTLNGTAVSVVNSTLSGNQATETGGGLSNKGTMTLVNATVSGNTAAAGGGAQAAGGALTLQRALVAGNTAPTGREVNLAAGTVAANSHNLFGFGGNAGLAGFAAGATDVVPGVAPAAVLGPLADNTGQTLTHALPAGSPAIDKGPSAACAATPVDGLDQRSQPRNVNGDGAASANECDIGAYEFASAGPVETPTATATPLMTETRTPTPTATTVVISTATPTATGTAGPSPTATATGTAGPSPTATATATTGPSPTATATATTGPSPTPGVMDEMAFMPVVVKP